MSEVPLIPGSSACDFATGWMPVVKSQAPATPAAQGLPVLLARCNRPKAGKPAGRAPLPGHEFTADAGDDDALDDRAMATGSTSSDAFPRERARLRCSNHGAVGQALQANAIAGRDTPAKESNPRTVADAIVRAGMRT